MYQYLATMRLHSEAGALNLTVGPKRRVLLKGVNQSASKSAIKKALRPLAAYWSSPSESDHEPGASVQPEVSVMKYLEFKIKARKLLTEAGLIHLAFAEPEEAETR